MSSSDEEDVVKMTPMEKMLAAADPALPSSDANISIGEGVRAAHGPGWLAGELINCEGPDVEGVVIAAHDSPGGYGVNVTMLVTKVSLKGGSWPAIQMPSKQVLLLVGEKLDYAKNANGEKVKLPYELAKEGWMSSITGVTTFELDKKLGGPNGDKELSASSVNMPGTRLALKSVAAKLVIPKDTAKERFFTNTCSAFELRGQLQTNSQKGIESVFAAFRTSGAESYYREAMATVGDHVGHRPPDLVSLADADALALADALEARIASDAKIGAGKSWERPLVPSAAREKYEQTIATLRGSVDVTSPHHSDSLGVLARTGVNPPRGKAKPVPLVQFPSTLEERTALLDKGLLMSPAMLHAANDGSKFFADAQFRPAAEKCRAGIKTAANPTPKGRSEEQICSESMTVAAWDASVWSFFHTKDDVRSKQHTLVTKTGDSTAQTVAVAKINFSLNKSAMCDWLGTYNYYFIFFLQQLAARHMPKIIFTSAWEQSSTHDELVPRTLTESWAEREDLYDFVTFLRTVGRPVPKEWVVEKMVDDDGCFRHPTNPIQQTLSLQGKPPPPRDPRPAKFFVNDYQLINAMKEVMAKKIIESDAEYFALYEACDQPTSEDIVTTLNGMEETDLYNHVAVYAVKPARGIKRAAAA